LPKKQLNNYLKYSGLAFQMIGAILVTAWLGSFIDKKVGNEKPLWTLTLMLLGVITSMYLLIKSVIKEK
jgi:ATP synthase protein I